jgi:hypothetical protein
MYDPDNNHTSLPDRTPSPRHEPPPRRSSLADPIPVSNRWSYRASEPLPQGKPREAGGGDAGLALSSQMLHFFNLFYRTRHITNAVDVNQGSNILSALSHARCVVSIVGGSCVGSKFLGHSSREKSASSTPLHLLSFQPRHPSRISSMIQPHEHHTMLR